MILEISAAVEMYSFQVFHNNKYSYFIILCIVILFQIEFESNGVFCLNYSPPNISLKVDSAVHTTLYTKLPFLFSVLTFHIRVSVFFWGGVLSAATQVSRVYI